MPSRATPRRAKAKHPPLSKTPAAPPPPVAEAEILPANPPAPEPAPSAPTTPPPRPPAAQPQPPLLFEVAFETCCQLAAIYTVPRTKRSATRGRCCEPYCL